MTTDNLNEPKSDIAERILTFTNSKIFPYLSMLVIALAIVLIYSNIHGNSTHFDDEFIFKNTDLHDPGDFEKLFSINKFRLVPFWTFAMNYASSDGGKDLGGFYTLNIIIHIINSIFAFGIAFLIFKTPVIRETRIARYGVVFAFFIGLMFAVHPLQTQGVAYIYQRLASIAATFYYGAILAYLAGRLIDKGKGVKIGLYALSFVFLILGLFSKENVFTIFPMILIIELLLFNKNFKLSPSVIGVFVGLIVVGIFIFLQFQVPSNIFAPLTNFNGETITSQSYLITQFKVLPLYLKLFILPFGQNFDHDIRVSDSFFDGSVLLGFGIILLVLAYAIYMYKYNRLITFGVLWFFLTIAVESSIIPIADVVFEHRVYLPMLGLILALIASLFEIFKRWEKLMPVMLILLFLVSAVNGVLANQRNKVWKSEITLWTDAISKSPQKARAYFKRGQAYLANNEVSAALDDFNNTIEKRPEFLSAYTYRAAIHLSYNRNTEALNDYEKFKDLSKDKTQGHLNIARVYSKMKLYNRALENYNAYLKRNNRDSEVYLEKAAVHEAMNDATNSIKTAKEACKADSTNADAIYAVGRYYYMKGEFDTAHEWIDKSLASPHATKMTKLNALNIKGSIYFFQKDYEQALIEYNKAFEINKKYKPLLVNLALAYREKNDYQKELEIIDSILEFDGKNDGNWLARGICNANLKNYVEADKDFKQALKINKKNDEAKRREIALQQFLN